MPLGLLVRDLSARYWMESETIAFAAWTGVLTFLGAFFVEELDVGEATAGWLLALGAAAYVVASSRAGALARRRSRRRLVFAAAMAMAVALPLLLMLGDTGIGQGLLLFCVAGLLAGMRTPASSGLGIRAAARASRRHGRRAHGGDAVRVLRGRGRRRPADRGRGWAALGVALGVGMAVSAVLVLRVSEPAAG